MITKEIAMEIIKLHAEWVVKCAKYTAHQFEGSGTKGAWYGMLSTHVSWGHIQGFFLDERGIVWNEEDKEEYGMLSNIVLSLEGKPKSSKPEQVWAAKAVAHIAKDIDAQILSSLIKEE